MSFTSYSGFVNELLAWPDVSLTTAQCDSIIGVSERQVNERLRVSTMETALNATANTSGLVAVPADYVELKSAYIDGSPCVRPLKRATPDEIYHRYPDRSSTSQTESLIAREGTNFVFGPAAAQGDVLKGIYYARPISMADGQTIQPTFSRYPQVYLYAALANLEPYIGRDPRIQVWATYYQSALDAANNEDARENASGTALQAAIT